MLSLLPASWSLSVVEAGLRRLGRAAVHRRRMAGVTRHLSRGRTVALQVLLPSSSFPSFTSPPPPPFLPSATPSSLQAELAAATRAPLVLLPSSYCVVCSKPFTQGGVARSGLAMASFGLCQYFGLYGFCHFGVTALVQLWMFGNLLISRPLSQEMPFLSRSV